MTTYCDVNTCEDCPRYGDDCDGRGEDELTNLISRADAIEAIEEETTEEWTETDVDFNRGMDMAKSIIKALPSADAVSREEYEYIIKDYRKQYENMNNEIADLEAKLSADAEWIPIATEPNTSNHVLVTYKWDGDDYEASELDYWVTKYEAEKGNEKCKWLIDHVIAWMPLPTPYKGGDTE